MARAMAMVKRIFFRFSVWEVCLAPLRDGERSAIYVRPSNTPFKHIFSARTTILYSKTPFSPGYNWLHRRPWLLAITAVPAIFQIATLPFCPESPKYLLLDKDDEHGAEEGLKDFDFQSVDVDAVQPCSG